MYDNICKNIFVILKKYMPPKFNFSGLFTIVLFCLLTALPHFIFGPGEDALSLTLEYNATFDDSMTMELIEKQKMKSLCRVDNSNYVIRLQFIE